jgi:hypothetical protein
MDDVFDEELPGNEGETGQSNTENGGKSTENSGVYVYSQAEEQGDKGGGFRRNELGQWVKGHAPPPPMRKRKPKANEQALIAALHEALPADKVKELLDKALTWAQEYKSPKLVLAILQFHYSYTLGMPVQRSVTASTKLETLLNRIGEMDDDQFAEVEQQMRSE